MNHERIGKYRIVGELGRGTMGEVYKAHDAVLNRYVALKTMSVHAGPADEALERFQREAQAAALLNHPNIVTIHDFGREQGLLFMAMELLEGSDLRDAIDRNTLRSLDRKLEIMDGVLAALEYAHGKGVIHRDVKPANIHLGPGGQVKIMDFGLARVSTSEMTQEGIVLGTPNYMSPEQAMGDRVDCRSDLFSTGAVLYELLTGHKPFEADSTPSVLFQVVHKEPPPVRRWAPDTPVPLVGVVERALRKNREQRFATATEMRTALAAARKSALAPPVLKPPPLPPRPPRPSGPVAVPRSIRVQGAPPLPPRPPAAPTRPSTTPPSARQRMPNPAKPLPAIASIPAGPPAEPEPSTEAKASVAASASSAARARMRTGLMVGGATLSVALLGWAAVSFWPRNLSPQPVPSPSAAAQQVGTLTQALVGTKVQLAERELEDKNYEAAVRQAETALQLSKGHPGASRVLAEARARVKELDAAVAAAREAADRGDNQAASRQLSRVLELDPRHPAAAELSARLNKAFAAEAAQAAEAMRTAQAGATAAGAAGRPEFTAAVEKARTAGDLADKGEHADATRTYLEARDAFDRARRAAGIRAPRTATGARPAAARPLSRNDRAPSRHRFEADSTAVSTPQAGNLEGFDTRDVSTRRQPEWTGELRFEVVPAEVRPGDPFVVRLRASNDGRRAVRVRSVVLATVVDGQRTAAPARTLEREMAPQKSTVLAEYSGVWRDVSSWALEAVVTSDRNETITARLRSH